MDATLNVERLRLLVEHTCQAVIDEGHDLSAVAIPGDENVVFEVHCAPGDIGLVIGRGGKHIEAVRTIVQSACRGANIRTSVEVVNSRR